MDIKFGTDGWRGVINKDFTEKNVALASQAIANYLITHGKKSIIIGFDVRRKAEKYARIATEVMAGNRIKVYLANKVTPTPTIGWAIIDKKADGGIMFTASHNPPEFLGLKYMTEEAMVAPTEVTDEFMKNLETLKPKQIKTMGFYYANEVRRITIFDPRTAYVKKLKELIDISSIKSLNKRVLLNPMHGAGVGYLKRLLSGGRIKLKEINSNHDPNFGGLSPEPIVEKNVLDAIDLVKNKKFDLCLSSDGDADRLGLIDETGKMLSSLEAFLLLTYYITEIKKEKGPVVRTLSNTVMVDHLGQRSGFPVFETKVGFKYVGEKMKEVGAVFGGEESGGSAVSNFMLVRDAQIMALFILELITKVDLPLSQILTNAQAACGGAYVFKREDIHFDYDQYPQIKEKMTKQLTEDPPVKILNKKVIKNRLDDGIKFIFEDDSWLLIRFSGTEPVLRLYSEAHTMEEVEELLNYAKDYAKN